MTKTNEHKTRIALSMVAGAQSAGGVCAWVDFGHQLDTAAVKAAGVELADLLISQPDDLEQGLEIVDTLLRTGAIDLVVISGLYPRWALASWSRYAAVVMFTESDRV